jgi:hypothetical protein
MVSRREGWFRRVAVCGARGGCSVGGRGSYLQRPVRTGWQCHKKRANDDWQNLVANGGSAKAFTAIAFDPSNFSVGNNVTDPSTFVQGAKDTDDVNEWIRRRVAFRRRTT